LASYICAFSQPEQRKKEAASDFLWRCRIEKKPSQYVEKNEAKIASAQLHTIDHRNLSTRRRMLIKRGNFFSWSPTYIFCVVKRGFVEYCKNVPL
jgi:hypothetical protein